MDKANIIISIIIVLCIAAAVAAYGITNSDNPIFSDLSSMSASDTTGNGIGNNTTTGNGTGASVIDVSNGGSGSGSSGSGSGSSGTGSSGSGSGSGSGSSSSGSGSGSGSGGSSVSASTIKSDAWNHIGEEGCYPGTPYYSGSYWYVTIYDANGSAVDSFQYSSSGSFLGRG